MQRREIVSIVTLFPARILVSAFSETIFSLRI
nr:MAG TPA: hypothetical protein [Caudoviricetes sp.]